MDCVKASQREVLAGVLADGGHEDHAAMISDLMRELRTVSRDKVRRACSSSRLAVRSCAELGAHCGLCRLSGHARWLKLCE